MNIVGSELAHLCLVTLSVLAWNQRFIFSHRHCQVVFDLVEINRRIQRTLAIIFIIKNFF